ncbi:glutamate racemase [Plesiocystis pacifica SIR-1]|uniref:Glutamate racemase n=1 Tax=Plesiocystis pacifica SIR-1 TaxID=391625 RepID=A6GHX7_9BACT|nr:glutamate racemase [Plesiocystis pacifica SIR-1]
MLGEMNDAPIGVFDSGVGGLTVLRALRRRLPNERFIYLGDTARLPYGTKSPETVARYAEKAAGVLVERGIKLLVIACNTASAVAVSRLAERFAPVPVIGVIEPGAWAACAATRSDRVLVIGTEGTINGGAYQRAIARRRPAIVVRSVACPLFVALAEEGWVRGPIPEAIARRYLAVELSGNEDERVDTLVLGCTHFPVLRGVLQEVCGPEVSLVDSAETTATSVARALEREGLAAGQGGGDSLHFLATDAPDRFARVGSVFLGAQLDASAVERVDL